MGRWVVSRGSCLVSRGSCVVGRGSWVRDPKLFARPEGKMFIVNGRQFSLVQHFIKGVGGN